MPTVHRPVMLAECLREMALESGSDAVDGTAGGGGHTVEILKRVTPGGRVLAIDRDKSMLDRARETVAAVDSSVNFFSGPYTELPTFMADAGVEAVDAILVDLGLSSDQLADRSRGFGFQSGGPLDLRFDASSGIPASEFLRTAGEEAILSALEEGGDLSRDDPVARAVVANRRSLQTTEELVRVVESAASRGKTHPATVVLQALRIAVNEELSHVRRAMSEVFPACLRPGGRLTVLTFHSGEDRIVKRAFADKAVWTLRQKKPILPRPAEVRENPRSRSAKLRVAVRSG